MTIPDSHKSSTGAPGEVLQQTELELLQSIFQLLRLLLDGEPVSVGRFAAATTRSLTEAETIFARLRAWGAEFDAAGDFTGAGVTLIPTPHHYTVNSRHFYTWCAPDTLFFPLMFGHTAVVESSDPVSGERIRATVGPGGIERIEPASAMLTSRKDGDADDVRGSMCQYGHYFTSQETAAEYVARQGGAGGTPLDILAPDSAFRLSEALTEQEPLRSTKRANRVDEASSH